MQSTDNDVKRCLIEDTNIEKQIGKRSPFPAILYCLSVIDMLAALYNESTVVCQEKRQNMLKNMVILLVMRII